MAWLHDSLERMTNEINEEVSGRATPAAGLTGYERTGK